VDQLTGCAQESGLKTSSRLILFSAIGLSTAMLCTVADKPVFAHLSEWRAISRSAGAALDKGRFSEAENGYLTAIQMLRKEEPKADAIYDLQLLLSETYRVGRNYGKARDLLEMMKPAILAEKFVDPTVAVRYWRRRAELEISTGNSKLGLTYYKRAIAILEKCFEPNSATLERNYLAVLPLACSEADYSYITYLVNHVGGVTDDPEAASKTTFAFGTIYAGVVKMLRAGDYNAALRLFRAINTAKFFLADRVNAGITFVSFCFARRHVSEALMAVPMLEELSAQVKKEMPTEKGIELRLAIAANLAGVFEYAGASKYEQRNKMYYEMLALIDSVKDRPISVLEKYRRAQAIDRLATSVEMPAGRATDKAVAMLQESVRFSVLPPKIRLNPDELRLIEEIHIDSRTCEAWAHLSRTESEKADASLASINGSVLFKLPAAALVHVINQYLDLANLYKTQNKLDKCNSTLAIFDENMVRFPASAERQFLLKRRDSLFPKDSAKPASEGRSKK
jgi:tetratricopeptide (TPR) repeat protein